MHGEAMQCSFDVIILNQNQSLTACNRAGGIFPLPLCLQRCTIDCVLKATKGCGYGKDRLSLAANYSFLFVFQAKYAMHAMQFCCLIFPGRYKEFVLVT